jgi:hypothetical protein
LHCAQNALSFIGFLGIVNKVQTKYSLQVKSEYEAATAAKLHKPLFLAAISRVGCAFLSSFNDWHRHGCQNCIEDDWHAYVEEC